MRKKPYILRSDVHDIGGKILAKAGQELVPLFLKELVRKRPSTSKSKPLSKYPGLINDYLEFCESYPYNKIFPEENTRKEVSTIMARGKMFPAVFESLRYFKEKNLYTYRHILMVSALATQMANDTSTLYRHALDAATVTPAHDIGKINTPVALLTKSVKLGKEEIELLREHTAAGLVILTYHIGEEDPLCCQVAFEHHELVDGSGYPRQIKQTNELIQLVTVCDIFDALVMPRPYRKENYTLRGALEVILQVGYEKKLNMNYVKLLIAYNRGDKASRDKLTLSRKTREKEPTGNKYSLGHIPPLKHPQKFLLQND